MPQNNVKTKRLQGGLGRRQPNADGVAGLITTGVSVSGGLQIGTVYPLVSIQDLEALKVDAAYDTTNKVLIHHHVSRFFLRNPSGTLYLLVIAQTATLTNLVDVANVNNAKKLLVSQNGNIKLLGVARNPATGYTPTLETGLDDDVVDAIPKAQALVEEEANEFRYVSIILEGRSYNGAAGSALDLRTLEAPGVSVVIAADLAISARDTLQNGYAAVGDALGMLSKAAVSQNFGEVIDDFNLQDTGRDLFVSPGLSSNLALNTYTTGSLDTLNDKGYIFGRKISGYSGTYFNDSSTCEALDSDYAYIENNRVIDKALNLSRLALIPNINSRLKVDETTGFLSDAVRGGLEGIAEASLDGMVNDGDISGGVEAYIDPETNVLAGDDIEIELTFYAVAIARDITVSVGFRNPLV